MEPKFKKGDVVECEKLDSMFYGGKVIQEVHFDEILKSYKYLIALTEPSTIFGVLFRNMLLEETQIRKYQKYSFRRWWSRWYYLYFKFN